MCNRTWFHTLNIPGSNDGIHVRTDFSRHLTDTHKLGSPDHAHADGW
jgi:hypothetical protein